MKFRQIRLIELNLKATQLYQLLMDIERVREFEKLQDIVDAEMEKKSECWQTLFFSYNKRR